MLPQAPVRARTISPVTPLIADVIFTELVDCNRRELPAYGTAHPDTTRWPHHKLGLIKPFADGKREEIYTFYYVADRDQQDLYNWEYVQADIGGQKFDAVVRTYVIPRSEYDPASDDNDPLSTLSEQAEQETGSTFGTLIERQIKRSGDAELDSLYVIVQNTYAALTTLVSYKYDEAYGCFLQSTQELVLKSSNPTAGFSVNIATEVSDLTARWSVVTTQEVVCSDLIDGVEYAYTDDFAFPAVLGGVREDVWERRDGGAETFLSPWFKRMAYKGPCSFRLEEQWQKDPFDLSGVIPSLYNPQPLPINVSTPMFSLSVEACLHDEVYFNVSTGTSHPVYKYTAGTFTFEATSPVELVNDEELLVSANQQRFRGGFLLRKQYVTVPAVPSVMAP
jgi:hypothetical protein